MEDIRRTVKVREGITGSRLIEAFKRIAERREGLQYAERTIYDLDGEKTLVIGVQSNYPFECVMARTGENLSNIEIKPQGIYEKVGVGSSMYLQSDESFNLMGFDEEEVVKAVEEIRDGLEEVLFGFP